MRRDERVTDEMVERARMSIVLGEDARGNSVHLTPEEARKVITTALSEQTLPVRVTPSEPTPCTHVAMDDDDRTPPPEGFDAALWRKADEAFHAMALIANDTECLKILYAALSIEQTEPVKVEGLTWKDGTYQSVAVTPFIRYSVRLVDDDTGEHWAMGVDHFGSTYSRRDTLEAAKAAAQQDYETRILSALVDVPAVEPEPAGEQWCAFEYGHQHTSWYPDGYGDRAGWEALAKRNPVKYQIVTRPLYAHPPVSALVNAQADADVVERLKEALKGAAEELDRISCVPRVTETSDIYDQFERAKFFADRGASAAWATVRSLRPAEVGSATDTKGQPDA